MTNEPHVPSTISVISRESGVVDLPMKVRLNFARALNAERTGDAAAAETFLNAAVEAEEATKAAEATAKAK